MTSLRKYLFGRFAEEQQVFLRTTKLLLQAVGLHAVNCDEADYEKFRSDINQLAAQLEDSPYSEALLVTGSAVKALEDYNRRLTRVFRSRQNELQSIVAMLTETISALGANSTRSSSRLQQLEKQLEKASAIEDLRAIKLRLADCLEELRTERRQNDQATQEHVCRLREGLEKARQELKRSAAAPGGTDSLSGLPERGTAEEVMAEGLASGRPLCAVVFVLDRLPAINARFGYAAGDRVMLGFLRHLKQSVARPAEIYRWTGPAFLLLAEASGQLVKFREDMTHIISTRVEETLRVGNRTVLLPVSGSCAVFPLSEAKSLPVLLTKIDNFVKGLLDAYAAEQQSGAGDRFAVG